MRLWLKIFRENQVEKAVPQSTAKSEESLQKSSPGLIIQRQSPFSKLDTCCNDIEMALAYRVDGDHIMSCDIQAMQ